MNLKISLNLLLFFVLFSRTTSQVDKGRPVEPGELNFLVQIRVTRRSPSGEKSSISTGSIINSKWILTVKHSFKTKEAYVPYKVEVLAGTKKSFKARGNEGQVKTIFINNNNVIRHRESDAALIYLGENAFRITNRAQPAVLIKPGQKLPAGTTCTTSGWGLFQGRFPENAMKGEVRIFHCRKHSNPEEDPVTGLCYEKTGAQQMSAPGDSGGPITCEVDGEKEVVVGIMKGSCSQNKEMRCSAVDVRRIHEWVQQHTKADSDRDAKSKKAQILGAFAAIGAVVFYYSR